MTRFYTPLTLLPTRGRWLLRLAQYGVLSAGRGAQLPDIYQNIRAACEEYLRQMEAGVSKDIV